MAEHNQLGKKGEQLAIAHLRSKGYKVRSVNWRHGRDELDIIAEKDEVLTFVEVKARSTAYFGDPEVFVTKAKQKRIIKLAAAYIEAYDIKIESRFDVVAVLYQGNKSRIHHIEGAFYPLA